MKRLLITAAVCILHSALPALSQVPTTPPVISRNADLRHQILWQTPSPAGYPYRIPAIAVSKRGHIVAVTDYRPCGMDIGFGEVDIMRRISQDNGQTWGEVLTIAKGDNTVDQPPYFGKGFGDAALVIDRKGREALIMCVSGFVAYPRATLTDHPCVARLRSHDGGNTWEKPEDVTPMFWGERGTSLFTTADGKVAAYGGFFGSGKILQSRTIRRGKYYRLYAAMLCRGQNMAGAYVVYSDDFGDTWQVLGGDASVQACQGSDEPKVEELPNGDIVLSGRKSYGRWFNVWSWDDKKHTTGRWGEAVESNKAEGGILAGANSCNGEILLVPARHAASGRKTWLMLQSLPIGDGRDHVTIYYREIDARQRYTSQTIAENWSKGIEVSHTGSGYSTMAMQKDGRIAFFYEEEPNYYNMVYLPLTLQEITGGNYR